MPRTRIAPTPSGYLHAGNAVNFLLVTWLARSVDADVVLRIDDMDAERYRREYVDDIFAVLQWLGIAWHHGPSGTADFEANYSLRDKADSTWSELLAGQRRGLDVYACTCSRRDHATGRLCTCRSAAAPLTRPREGTHALRVHVPAGVQVQQDGEVVDLHAAMGDFVVWRRDDQPAYQLASVIADRDLGITHVVRGRDLLESTAAQRFIAPALDASTFADAVFIHHGLLTGLGGEKLSKSQLAVGPMERTNAGRSRIVEAARAAAAACGIPPG